MQDHDLSRYVKIVTLVARWRRVQGSKAGSIEKRRGILEWKDRTMETQTNQTEHRHGNANDFRGHLIKFSGIQ